MSTYKTRRYVVELVVNGQTFTGEHRLGGVPDALTDAGKQAIGIALSHAARDAAHSLGYSVKIYDIPTESIRPGYAVAVGDPELRHDYKVDPK